MVKKVAPGFTSMMPRLLVVLAFLVSCDPVLPFNDIPYIPFNDIEINTNLPLYSNLRIDGGMVELDDGGVRGIIIYRENALTYHAIERNCSWLPNEACSTVDPHPSGLSLFDSCCGSTFSLPNGIPIGGPAIYSLRKYLVIVDGSIITITDTIIN